VVYVVEVEVPVDYAFSAMDAAARAVMDSVRTQTALPTRAWVSVAEDADAVLAVFEKGSQEGPSEEDMRHYRRGLAAARADEKGSLPT
jgi:hypothetical protein